MPKSWYWKKNNQKSSERDLRAKKGDTFQGQLIYTFI